MDNANPNTHSACSACGGASKVEGAACTTEGCTMHTQPMTACECGNPMHGAMESTPVSTEPVKAEPEVAPPTPVIPTPAMPTSAVPTPTMPAPPASTEPMKTEPVDPNSSVE